MGGILAKIRGWLLNIVYHLKGFGQEYTLRQLSQNMGRGFWALEQKVCKKSGFCFKIF